VPESAPLDPRSGYAATKLAQEHLADRSYIPGLLRFLAAL
jgi:hypothetical protein